MPERGGASLRPNRRQLLGLLGAGGITTLSAALVATSSAFDDENGDDTDDSTADAEDASDGDGGSDGGETSDEEESDEEESDEEESDEEPHEYLSVAWESTYGAGDPGSFAAVRADDTTVDLGGVRLDGDEAGEGWLVEGPDPETDLTEHLYISSLNEERRDRDEGYAVHDAIEAVIGGGDERTLVGWTHDLNPDSKTAWARRIDRSGAVRWEREYARPAVNSFRDVFLDGVATDDGGAVLAGVTLGAEFVDTRRGEGWLARIAADGELAWERTYNTAETTTTDWVDDERHDRFTTIRAIDGGYLLAGTTTLEESSDTMPSEPWVLAVDESGEPLWEAIDDRESSADGERRDRVVADVAPAADGYLAVGTVGNYEYDRPFRSNVLEGDGWIGHVTDEAFDWQRRIEATSLRTIQPVGRDHHLISGMQEGGAWVGVIDPDGELVDERRLHEAEGDVHASARTGDGTVVAGYRTDEGPVGFAASISVTLPER